MGSALAVCVPQWCGICKGNLFLRFPLESGKHAQFYVWGNVGSTSFGCNVVRVFTLTDILLVNHVDLGAAALDAVRLVLFPSNVTVMHGKGKIF